MKVREKDGIHFGSGSVVADSRNALGDLNFVSHAHHDHLNRNDGRFLCSRETAVIGGRRRGKQLEYVEEHPDVELLPSGHIVGSRAAVFRVNGEKVLYTGDVSTRDRVYLEGFRPVEADVLVVESTYGVPAYRFPSQDELEKRIKDWLLDADRPVFLSGYALGKAQKLQKLVEDAVDLPVYADGKVHEMNRAVEEVSDLDFRAEKFEGELPGDAVLVTSSLKKREELVRRHEGTTAGFSGWAAGGSFGSSRFDRYFPFSDHCDFDDLVELVKAVDPEKVYTHHGFDEAFASYLSSELGFNARPLKKNQLSLTDF